MDEDCEGCLVVRAWLEHVDLEDQAEDTLTVSLDTE